MTDDTRESADAEFVAEGLDDRFEVLELLGRGGAGRVYRARQYELRRDVAIKIVDITGHTQELPLEVRTQSTLSWHSHILTLHEAHLIDNRYCVLVMELAANGSIQSELSATGPLSIARILQVGREIAEALVAAHSLGVVHCDIKPSNILVAADATTRLADFGISRLAGATLDTFDSFRGSLRFVPPELLDGATPSEANDVYGLATTLWAAATGETPFGAIDEPTTLVMSRLASERLDFDRFEDDPDLPTAAFDALNAALAKSPEERPSMPELLAALTAASPASSLHAGTERPVRRRAADARRTRGRRALAAVGIVVAIVAAAAGGAAVTRRHDVAVVTKPLCTVWHDVVGAKAALFKKISVELFLTNSAVDAVRRLIMVYPAALSEIYASLQDTMQTEGLLAPTQRISQAQLRDLFLADAARSLNQRPPFLFDGFEDAFDERNAPTVVRESARLLSNVNATAVRHCPKVPVDLSAGKRSMRDAVSLRIVKDSDFIDSFFSDPESLAVLDARSLSVLLQAANDFMIGLVHNHWDWYVQLLATSEEIRTTVTYERPDLLLLALQSDPTTASTLGQPQWIKDLRDSISKLDQTRAAGIRGLYSPQLTALGI